MAKKKEDIVMEEVEVKEEPKPVRNETEEFIARELKAINSMSNKAKAQRCAERVLANRKGNK